MTRRKLELRHLKRKLCLEEHASSPFYCKHFDHCHRRILALLIKLINRHVVYVFDPPPKHVYRERVAHDIYCGTLQAEHFLRCVPLTRDLSRSILALNSLWPAAVYMVGHIDTRNSTSCRFVPPIYLYEVFRCLAAIRAFLCGSTLVWSTDALDTVRTRR